MKANVTAYLNFRYEKIRLLKKSDRSEIWLALNKSTNQPVAMKIINAVGLPYAELKNLQIPLLAKIFYCAESETDTVIVEEFLTGETLDGKKLTETETRQILLQLCNGLKVLHGRGIIHRDIKPSNLILHGEKIYLIDFDAARIFKDGQFEDTKILGTKGYAPPEQFGFGQTDCRSDIYSLGKTFLELTNCGSDLKKILSKCVEVDPKNRYQNIDELQAALTAKNFPLLQICASFAAVVTGACLFFNSTVAEIIPPQIEKVSDVETPAKIEKPVANVETPAENKNPTANVETPAEIEKPVTNVEDIPRSKRRAEILTPLPQPVTIENFQPSFPAAPTFYNETTQNLGGVKLGDSLQAVENILGNAEEIKTYDGFNFEYHSYENLNVMIENNQATCITTKNANVATLRGIRQGDSLEKVLAAYGDNFSTQQFGEMATYIYSYDSAELRFTVENNFVTAITLIATDEKN